MSYISIWVENQFEQPLPGVLVKLIGQNGVEVAEGVTDQYGGFYGQLAAAQTYQVRLYLQQVRFGPPQTITPTDSEMVENQWWFTGQIVVPPTANDPRRCCVSGVLQRADGSPLRNTTISLYPVFDPATMDQSALLTDQPVRIRTDRYGYACKELPRNAQYGCEIEGFEGQLRHIAVPDLPSCLLASFIFPTVLGVTFNPPGAWTIQHGTILLVTPTVVTSAGVILHGTALSDVLWGSDNQTVLGVLPGHKQLTLTAIAAGTANLTAYRTLRLVQIPARPIQGVPVLVTVV